MQEQDWIAPGREVQVASTGRKVLVRGIEGEQARCAWFDGMYCHEVWMRISALRPCPGGPDDRMITIA